MSALVRAAGPEEADHLDRWLDAPPGTYAGLLGGPEGVGCELLVAEVDGVPVGAVLLRGSTEPPGISDLLVHPDERGDGHGTALVQAACARARAAGHRRVGIGVDEGDHRAARLYRRLGFVETGEPGPVRHLERDLA